MRGLHEVNSAAPSDDTGESEESKATTATAVQSGPCPTCGRSPRAPDEKIGNSPKRLRARQQWQKNFLPIIDGLTGEQLHKMIGHVPSWWGEVRQGLRFPQASDLLLLPGDRLTQLGEFFIAFGAGKESGRAIPESPTAASMGVMAGVGQTIANVKQAIADGRVDSRELTRSREDIAAARQHLDDLELAMQAAHQESQED